LGNRALSCWQQNQIPAVWDAARATLAVDGDSCRMLRRVGSSSLCRRQTSAIWQPRGGAVPLAHQHPCPAQRSAGTAVVDLDASWRLAAGVGVGQGRRGDFRWLDLRMSFQSSVKARALSQQAGHSLSSFRVYVICELLHIGRIRMDIVWINNLVPAKGTMETARLQVRERSAAVVTAAASTVFARLWRQRYRQALLRCSGTLLYGVCPCILAAATTTAH
jgi:hypothetical protein